MSEEEFADFLARIRAGDRQAADAFYQRYAPLIRREVRLHLNDPALGRLVDASDICQAVLGSFFLRAAAGQYRLEHPAQLLGLLKEMARRKLAAEGRRHRAQRRDGRRLASRPVDEIQPAGDGPTPSRVVGRELLAEFRRRLSEEEGQVVERRAQGQSWAEIAAALGGTPDGRRMQYTRAIDRVTRELGLEETGEG